MRIGARARETHAHARTQTLGSTDNVLDTPRGTSGTTSRRSEKRYLAAPRSKPRLISASIRAFERPTLIIARFARSLWARRSCNDVVSCINPEIRMKRHTLSLSLSLFFLHRVADTNRERIARRTTSATRYVDERAIYLDDGSRRGVRFGCHLLRFASTNARLVFPFESIRFKARFRRA